MNRAGFQAWCEAYEQAGLRATSRVPTQLASVIGANARILSSDVPRAIESARLLAHSSPITSSSLLRELRLGASSPTRLRLPLLAWALVVGHATWTRRRRGEFPTAAEDERIGHAVEWLEREIVVHPCVVVVTHASFRRELHAALRLRDWRSSSSWRSTRPWSAWILTRHARHPEVFASA